VCAGHAGAHVPVEGGAELQVGWGLGVAEPPALVHAHQWVMLARMRLCGKGLRLTHPWGKGLMHTHLWKGGQVKVHQGNATAMPAERGSTSCPQHLARKRPPDPPPHTHTHDGTCRHCFASNSTRAGKIHVWQAQATVFPLGDDCIYGVFTQQKTRILPTLI